MKTFILLLGIILAVGVIIGTVIYFRNEKRKLRDAATSTIRDRVLELVRKLGVKSEIHPLVRDEFADEEPSIISAAFGDVYRMACDKAAEDGIIEPKELVYLNRLAVALDLDEAATTRIMADAKNSRFKSEALELLAQGIFNNETFERIQSLKTSLQLKRATASELAEQETIDAYVALFRRVIEDGRITPEELSELAAFRTATGLDKARANEIIRDDGLRLYRQWFTNIIQDGEILPDEEKALLWLRDEFGLHSAETRDSEREIESIKQFSRLRKGDLPTVRTSKLLESGEICHWESACTYVWATPTQTKSTIGEILITSHKIVFMSPGKTFSYSPSSILDIELYRRSVVITTSVSKGSGTYYMDDVRYFEALLVGLARRHKYTAVSQFGSEMSRHIPDAVRREVYHRDGGCCVRCKAMEYLEFDHIIPHSKGGANTVNNVQLLCRNCNLEKSDRI